LPVSPEHCEAALAVFGRCRIVENSRISPLPSIGPIKQQKDVAGASRIPSQKPNPIRKHHPGNIPEDCPISGATPPPKSKRRKNSGKDAKKPLKALQLARKRTKNTALSKQESRLDL
jgi:hypothetical protein